MCSAAAMLFFAFAILRALGILNLERQSLWGHCCERRVRPRSLASLPFGVQFAVVAGPESIQNQLLVLLRFKSTEPHLWPTPQSGLGLQVRFSRRKHRIARKSLCFRNINFRLWRTKKRLFEQKTVSFFELKQDACLGAPKKLFYMR